MWQVKIRNSAKADLKKLKHSNLKDSFNDIVTQLKEDPYKNNQGFEKLVPPIAKKYSRRLNIQHRVVYSVDDKNKTVNIWSTWSHYE
ncbi:MULTISPECIES: Txe/YoeB family addiction module toxin [Lactobacillus]|uniref:Endoribonuclease YoeB n=1 Tax=Lactobacillus johnsonii TaxID=33959 RepID=A0A9X0J7N2_LACJH|nr:MULTISPECIES: Txe/YoeB family addiction module toxin [Lactobacillus]KXN76510.1 addiction module protein [Lactobacillus johnsonii]MCR1903348.1 Txe/YoeB family addiction module toxin [Lactobacillus taiwanensis]